MEVRVTRIEFPTWTALRIFAILDICLLPLALLTWLYYLHHSIKYVYLWDEYETANEADIDWFIRRLPHYRSILEYSGNLEDRSDPAAGNKLRSLYFEIFERCGPSPSESVNQSLDYIGVISGLLLFAYILTCVVGICLLCRFRKSPGLTPCFLRIILLVLIIILVVEIVACVLMLGPHEKGSLLCPVGDFAAVIFFHALIIIIGYLIPHIIVLLLYLLYIVYYKPEGQEENELSNLDTLMHVRPRDYNVRQIKRPTVACETEKPPKLLEDVAVETESIPEVRETSVREKPVPLYKVRKSSINVGHGRKAIVRIGVLEYTPPIPLKERKQIEKQPQRKSDAVRKGASTADTNSGRTPPGRPQQSNVPNSTTKVKTFPTGTQLHTLKTSKMGVGRGRDVAVRIGAVKDAPHSQDDDLEAEAQATNAPPTTETSPPQPSQPPPVTVTPLRTDTIDAGRGKTAQVQIGAVEVQGQSDTRKKNTEKRDQTN